VGRSSGRAALSELTPVNGAVCLAGCGSDSTKLLFDRLNREREPEGCQNYDSRSKPRSLAPFGAAAHMARALTAPATPVRFLPPVDLIRFVRPEFERPSDEHEMRARASRPAELPELARSGGSPRRRRGRRSRRRDNGQSPARPARRASQARRRSSLKRARALRAARPSSTRAPPTIVRRRLNPGSPLRFRSRFPPPRSRARTP
jgi:hypothetical protein